MPRLFRFAGWISVAALVFALALSGENDGLLTFAATARRRPPPPPAPKTNALQNIPYTKAANPKTARRQTLDLYLPPKSASQPPLVIFIHGGFWTLTDDDYRLGPTFAEALVPLGVAVAVVRYRLAPTNRHPAQAQDVAAAVAYLLRMADKHGYDKKRTFLAGHSAGAHLAALVALDSGYLAAHRLNPGALAGVIGFSGIYNLHPTLATPEEQRWAVQQAFGENPAALKNASPVTHARATIPFLILGAASDFPGFLIDAKQFADALRAAGHREVSQFIIPERNHFSLLQLTGADNEVQRLLLDFMRVKPLSPSLAAFVETRRSWRDPPFSTLPFWQHEELIEAIPVDARFVDALLPVYTTMRHELLEWPLEKYHAIDLFAYLDSLPPEKAGRGNYLTITNLRNEKLFWDRRQIERYRPVIVIGIDEEDNLFRFSVFYRPRREYTWKAAPAPPLMVRPLGAFIYFLEEPPPELAPQPSFYALTENSFQLTEQDPVAALRTLPKALYETLTFRNGCVYCHSVGGVGSQSHHMTAANGRPHGGLALPLESYPEEVWKAFLLSQHEVAAQIGAFPNVVDEESRQALYALVVELRQKTKTPVP